MRQQSDSNRMAYLEERLRQMEAALQGSGSQPSAPSGTQLAFRESTTSSSQLTQLSAVGHPTALARQGAMFDINAQAEVNNNGFGRQEMANHTDPRILSPVTTRYESNQHHGHYQATQTTVQGAGAYQPFLGMHSLSNEPLSTSNVNHARRISASTLVHRTRNGRAVTGRAVTSQGSQPVQRTGLLRGSNLAHKCRIGTKIRLQIRVYPPRILDVSFLYVHFFLSL